MKSTGVLLTLLTAAWCAPLLIGCVASSGPETLGDGASNGSTMESPDPATACSQPAEGCPCDEPGAKVDCRGATIHDGSYVTCPAGKRTCTNEGTWGPCVSPSKYVPVPSAAPANSGGHKH
jgi:hypothetical protein